MTEREKFLELRVAFLEQCLQAKESGLENTIIRPPEGGEPPVPEITVVRSVLEVVPFVISSSNGIDAGLVKTVHRLREGDDWYEVAYCHQKDMLRHIDPDQWIEHTVRKVLSEVARRHCRKT